MKLNCARIDQLKEAYIDGTLATELRAAIDAHAFECATCRRKLAMARQVKAFMGGAVKTAVGRPYVSQERVSRIQDHIARRTSSAPALVLRRRTLAAPALALLLLLSAALGSYQLGVFNAFVKQLPYFPPIWVPRPEPTPAPTSAPTFAPTFVPTHEARRPEGTRPNQPFLPPAPDQSFVLPIVGARTPALIVLPAVTVGKAPGRLYTPVPTNMPVSGMPLSSTPLSASPSVLTATPRPALPAPAAPGAAYT